MSPADEKKVRASFTRLRSAITSLSAMVQDARGMCLDLHKRLLKLEGVPPIEKGPMTPLEEGIANAQNHAPIPVPLEPKS